MGGDVERTILPELFGIHARIGVENTALISSKEKIYAGVNITW